MQIFGLLPRISKDVTNCDFLGGSISFIVPLIIGEITNDDRYGMSWEAWMIIFATASAIYIVSNIFYVFMISGDIQPWNYSHVST